MKRRGPRLAAPIVTGALVGAVVAVAAIVRDQETMLRLVDQLPWESAEIRDEYFTAWTWVAAASLLASVSVSVAYASSKGLTRAAMLTTVIPILIFLSATPVYWSRRGDAASAFHYQVADQHRMVAPAATLAAVVAAAAVAHLSRLLHRLRGHHRRLRR